MRGGRFAEAVADLRVAFDANVKDAEVPNALAFALMQTGQSREASGRAEARARTAPRKREPRSQPGAVARDPRPTRDVRDGALALRLALDVRERTGGRDPRALDTLAAAYAASGRLDLARETSSQAAALAQQLGDTEAAGEIAAHARGYRR